MINSDSVFSRKLDLKKWLGTINYHGNQLTPNDIATHICLALQKEQKKYNDSINKSIHKNRPQKQQYEQMNNIQQLWKSNEYFYESLIDLSEDILHYAYASLCSLREKKPRCFIGYYQIVKNILNFRSIYSEKEANSIQEIVQYDIPQVVKEFYQEKMASLLFGIINVSQLRTILTKFQESSLMKQFRLQIQDLIIQRVKLFSIVYQLPLVEHANKIFTLCLFSRDDSKNEACDPPIDQLLLCLVYLFFKKNKEIVVFKKIIGIYEEKFKISVKKELLLIYFNVYFLTEYHDILKLSCQSTLKLQNQLASKIIGNQIKEQISIFDMFKQ